MDEVKKASEIEDCSDCPLYQTDCPGGWTYDGSGRPIEPPCTSWNCDEEIYEGMYYYEPSEDDIAYWNELSSQREAERKKQAHLEEIDQYRKVVRSLTGGEYKHIEFRRNASIIDDWLCPYCHRWGNPGWESIHNGIAESWCIRCNRRLVFCSELEKEDYGE